MYVSNKRNFFFFSCKVLLALKKIIRDEELFDPRNPTIILCDEALERALNVLALHVSDLR
jgi:hypothetical protein